jgi:ketosteroid isomerase-like protein
VTQAPQVKAQGEERPEAPAAEAARSPRAPSRAEVSTVADAEKPADGRTEAELRGALDGWVAATNARDVQRQMQFYGQTLDSFYLSRNASREAVREEKARLFGAASAVDVRADAPDIRLGRDGRTAVMRFRKRYQIGGAAGGTGRSGEVLQELRWRRTPNGWKIVGERDLRVLQ